MPILLQTALLQTAPWHNRHRVMRWTHSCPATAREASSACAPELGQVGLRRGSSCAMAVMCWGSPRAFLQLVNDVGEHLRHLVVRAELDHPDRFLDDNGVA